MDVSCQSVARDSSFISHTCCGRAPATRARFHSKNALEVVAIGSGSGICLGNNFQEVGSSASHADRSAAWRSKTIRTAMNSAKEIGQCARFSAGFRSSRENIPAHPGRASAVAITYSLRSSSGTPSASSAAAMTIFAGVRSMAIRRKSSSAPRQRRGTEAPEAKSNDTAIKKPSERFGSVMLACP